LAVFWVGARYFSYLQRVQTDSGAHPASYTFGTGGSFLGCKAVSDVKPTADIHLVPRLNISGAMLPLPHTSL